MLAYRFKLMITLGGSSKCYNMMSILDQTEKSIKASLFRGGKLTNVTVFTSEILGIMIEMLHFLLSSTPTSRPLESSLHRWYRFHFHAIIFRFRKPACTRPSNSPRSEALITLLVFTFEMQICGWPWSAKHGNVVLYPVALGERSVSVDFGEFVRIEVFPCGFASAHKK